MIKNVGLLPAGTVIGPVGKMLPPVPAVVVMTCWANAEPAKKAIATSN